MASADGSLPGYSFFEKLCHWVPSANVTDRTENRTLSTGSLNQPRFRLSPTNDNSLSKSLAVKPAPGVLMLDELCESTIP